MRRTDREIREFDEIVEVIKRCDVCRLALNDTEYPYILPLNFGVEVQDRKIILYFHGAEEGTKYELMARNPKASFEMDCSHKLISNLENGNCNCTMEYESVIGQGTIEILPDEEKYNALSAIMKQYHHEIKTPFQFGEKTMSHTKVWKLTVHSCTGKRRKKH